MNTTEDLFAKAMAQQFGLQNKADELDRSNQEKSYEQTARGREALLASLGAGAAAEWPEQVKEIAAKLVGYPLLIQPVQKLIKRLEDRIDSAVENEIDSIFGEADELDSQE